MIISSSKKIAKNTILLYIRMMCIMLVSLYTSRIVLTTLGVEDFGIYNIVGGVVIMFSFLNIAMSTSTQRFLSYELGKNDPQQLNITFFASIIIHLFIALIILLLAETLGIWFLTEKLNIPASRMSAAKWTLQFSLFAFFFSIIRVPFNASIIAHEKMNIYAYLSIAEALLKLLMVLALQYFNYDKLILYSILVFLITLIMTLVYGLYVFKYFHKQTFIIVREKKIYRRLISYSGWNLFGSSSIVVKGEGLNILLNMFFGAPLNAARGIALQVSSAINGLVSNFQVAINPPIVKSYVQKDFKTMYNLIFKSSKYSFFLLYIIVLPVILKMDSLLGLWLKVVPSYAVLFTQLILINVLVDTISGPSAFALQATGRIKKYQMVVGLLQLLNLPIAYVFLQNGFKPETVFYISIIISIIAVWIRLLMTTKIIGFSFIDFFKKVILIIGKVVILSLFISILFYIYISTALIPVLTFTFFIILISIYILGLEQIEQKLILEFIKKIIKKGADKLS